MRYWWVITTEFREKWLTELGALERLVQLNDKTACVRGPSLVLVTLDEAKVKLGR